MLPDSFKELSEQIFTKYPSSIATAWRHVYRSSAKKEEHDRLIDLYEISVVTVATMLISQYISDGLSDEKVDNILSKIPIASFGTWVDIVENLQLRYAKGSAVSFGRAISAELGKKASFPEQKKAIIEIAQISGQNIPSVDGKHNILNFLRWMVTYRNEIAHAKPSPSEDVCNARIDWLKPATLEFLEILKFLMDFPFYYIEQVQVEIEQSNCKVRSVMGWDLDRRNITLGILGNTKRQRLYVLHDKQPGNLLIPPLIHYEICKKCNYEPRVFLLRKVYIQSDNEGNKSCREIDFTCVMCGGHTRVSDPSLTQEFLGIIGAAAVGNASNQIPKPAQKDEMPEQVIKDYLLKVQEIYSKYYRTRYVQPEMKAIHVTWHKESASGTDDTLLQDLYKLTGRNPDFGFAQEMEVSDELKDLRMYAQELHSFVLLGDSGCGKSSALLWLLANWQDQNKIPIFVSLSRYDSGSVEDFLAKSWALSICISMRADKADEANLENQITVLIPFLNQLMLKGKLVVLFDGLNELPMDDEYSKRLGYIRDYIEIATSRDNIVIVGCRKNDYAEQFPKLHKVEIFPLDDAKIRNIISAYLGETKGAEIWNSLALATNSKLRELVRNPFMLMAFITVCNTQGGDLPSAKAVLFNMLSTMSINRELQKNSSLSTSPKDLVEKISSAIAYTITLSGRVNIDKNELAKRLPEAWFFDPKRTISVIDSALSILTSARIIAHTPSQGGDTLTFTHQLWQEYYSARLISAFYDPEIRGLISHILNSTNIAKPIDIIRPHLHKAKWANVIIMVSLLLPSQQASEYISDIFNAGSEMEELLYRDTLLASTCIQEAANNIQHSEVAEVIKKLESAQAVGIMPLKSVAEQAHVSILAATDQEDSLFAYAVDESRSWEARYLAVQSLEKMQNTERAEKAWLAVATNRDINQNTRAALARSFEVKGYKDTAFKVWMTLSEERSDRNIRKEARKAIKRLRS